MKTTLTYYHLGSWTTITGEDGEIEQELSFDAWGNFRNPYTWTGANAVHPMFDRGFTGHEHLFEFGLINMKFALSESRAKFYLDYAERCKLGEANGRMYDPVMSSFLSVDNYVQSPENSQNFNRYAYCLNNPLKYTDPDGEWVQYVVGGLLGAFNGYSIGKAAGLTGWNLAWSTIGGAAVGAITGGIGTSVTSSVGMGAGSLCAGAVSGSGYSIIQGMANHEDVGSILTSSILGGLYGGVSGWIGGSVGAVVGGGTGAFLGGAASNITSQLLTHDYSSGEKFKLNWKSALFSSCMSFGIYIGSSYMNYCRGAKDFHPDGQTISFEQYLEIQSSYTRGRFFKEERAGGGFWLTPKGTSTQGISYSEKELEHNFVSFDFSKKPDDAFSTYHPHPYDESGYYQGRQIADGNLWHSDVDIANVRNNEIPSMIVNKYGAEYVTADCKYRNYNWWGYGKPYYTYPWFCASYYFKLKQ